MAEICDRGAQLYAAYLGGNEQALEELVKMYGDPLTRFAYCIVHDDDCAEDVTADTFAVLIVKRKHFRGESKFRTWLYSVARNRAIDYVRKSRRCGTLSGLENVLTCSDDHSLEKSERLNKLYACMQQLQDGYKEVLCLSYFDGFSVGEICHILKKSAKQVYNLLARAKSSLKNIMLKEGYSYEDF